MFFRISFTFLDYTKAWWLVILENLGIFLSWEFIAYLISLIFNKGKRGKKETGRLDGSV